MELEFAVLGGVRAFRGGEPIDLGGRRQRAVLALLVVARGSVVSAERLIDALWPDDPPPKPQSALQAYVSHLRRALEPDRPARARTGLIVSLPAGYAVRVDPDAVDAWRFEQAVNSDDPDAWRAALTLWKGEPYADYPGAPWAVAERARLGELRAAASEALAAVRLDAGASAGLIAELEALAEEEPLREQRWRLLALALYRAQRQAEALGALRRARDLLRDELGVDPGPALRELESDILAQAPTLVREPLPARPVTPVPVVRSEQPLFGRDDVLARLCTVPSTLALVAGDPGSGKSALLTALDRHRSAEGWQVAWGHCPEVDGAPALWPWMELLRGLPGADDVTALRPLLQDTTDAPAEGATPRFRLWGAVAGFLRRFAAQRPLLLVLDDIHRADRPTLDLLCHVLADLRGARITVVAAYRPAETSDPLASALGLVARYHPARITLDGLPAEATAALVRATAGRPLAAAEVADAVRRSDGNPFYARELGLLLAAGGTGAGAIPAGVRDVVRHRVSLLPGAAPTALKVAAVTGRSVDLDVVLSVLGDAGVDEDDVLDAVDAALVAGLLEADGDRLRFSHVLTRDALYEQISPLRRARWHALVAEATSRLRPHDVAALARHYALAGNGFAAASSQAAAAAAAQAEGRCAYGEAARLWQQAADAADVAGRPAAERVTLLLSRCRALIAEAARDRALDVRAEAIALARTAGDPALLATACTAWAVPTLWLQGVYLTHDPVLAAELTTLLDTERDDELRCRLLCALVSEVEDPAAAVGVARRQQLADEALAIAERLDDPHLIGLSVGAGLRASYFDGPPGRRAELAATALRAGRRANRPLLVLLGEQASAQVAIAAGDVRTFERHRRAATALADELQLGSGLLVGIANRALSHAVAGRFADADAAYRELGESMLSAGDPKGHLLSFAGRLAVAEAQGNLGALLPELLALPDFRSMASDPAARILIAAGRHDEARTAWRPDDPIPPDFLAQPWHACRIQNAIAFDAPDVVRASYAALRPYADRLCGAVSGTLTFAPVAQYLGDAAVYLGEPAAAHYAAAEVLARRAGAAHYVERVRSNS